MLPNNLYYKDGALINANREKTHLKSRVQLLEQKVSILIEELNNVNNKLAELSNTKTNTEGRY